MYVRAAAQAEPKDCGVEILRPRFDLAVYYFDINIFISFSEKLESVEKECGGYPELGGQVPFGGFL